ALNLSDRIAPEETQIQAGGVNYGWYRVAAHYVSDRPTLDLEQISEIMKKLTEDLATWAEDKEILPAHESPTQAVFDRYLESYLEIQGWESKQPDFQTEYATYSEAKTKAAKQPICSLSSGEFTSENQMDSVVLFKPQQYSNKNSLGGRQLKRGISKIWALEMLLRQARWSVQAGKFEEQQPVFLYIFPAYLYSPQMAAAMRLFAEEIMRVNLWDIRKHWLQEKMDLESLRSLPWRKTEKVKDGRFAQDRYESADLPFMATIYTTTRGKTVTEAWIEPAFLALALPLLLGVKVVATSSTIPLYNSDRDFLESTLLDGAAGFWTLLQLSPSLRLQEIPIALERLLAIYCLHLETRSNAPDARWPAFNSTVREVMTDVLNVFVLANEGLRGKKRDPSDEEVLRYWKFAELFTEGKPQMSDKLELTQRLVEEYRTFYRVRPHKSSSHAILLPLSKALEEILSVPDDWNQEEMILQGSGLLKDALDRQEAYNRPFLLDKSLPYETRLAKELEAIRAFMTTCVEDLFGGMCKGDRALLQENRNRIESGAEFAYRWLALQEKSESTVGPEDSQV
ncbi:type I-D CRISPR-associated protein Cas10d/Csc3, partial [Spirulina sp. 06S082]|uniref:type I-D CRISPR-associated protein Cas10d/Csc3 n=1 Tax=Spirulina sp. 06S082 TaxID=3110248 RepID=UPI002B212283